MPDSSRSQYESWVNQWAPTLYRLALRLSGKRELAEDLLQETFTEAWKARDRLSDPAKARAWLFQILRNRWSHHLRDSSRRLRPSHDQDALARVGSRAPAHPEVLAESDFVQRALDQLDDDVKLPFLCVVMEGYSCQETADLLKIPLGTVLSRLHRARKALRVLLAPAHAEYSRSSLADSRPGTHDGGGVAGQTQNSDSLHGADLRLHASEPVRDPDLEHPPE